mgnify:FL=1
MQESLRKLAGALRNRKPALGRKASAPAPVALLKERERYMQKVDFKVPAIILGKDSDVELTQLGAQGTVLPSR